MSSRDGSRRITRRPDAVFTGDTSKRLAEGYREEANAAAAEGTLAWAQLTIAAAWSAVTEEDPNALRARIRQLEQIARDWGNDLDTRTDNNVRQAPARTRTATNDDSDSLGLGLSA